MGFMGVANECIFRLRKNLDSFPLISADLAVGGI